MVKMLLSKIRHTKKFKNSFRGIHKQKNRRPQFYIAVLQMVLTESPSGQNEFLIHGKM